MQLCDNCGKNQANIHLTQIVNNETTVFKYCEECASKKGISINLGDLASSSVIKPAETEKEITCGKCGTKLSEFREKGWLGCSECYSAFYDEVERLLMQVHGSSEHRGKQYIRKSAGKRRPSIKQLRAELDAAIMNEQFELAAEIRDTIKDLTASEETR